jgi:hypothetical protein
LIVQARKHFPKKAEEERKKNEQFVDECTKKYEIFCGSQSLFFSIGHHKFIKLMTKTTRYEYLRDILYMHFLGVRFSMYQILIHCAVRVVEIEIIRVKCHEKRKKNHCQFEVKLLKLKCHKDLKEVCGDDS